MFPRNGAVNHNWYVGHASIKPRKSFDGEICYKIKSMANAKNIRHEKKVRFEQKELGLTSVKHLFDTVFAFAAGCGYLWPGGEFLRPDCGRKWPSKSESRECGKQP